MEEPTGFFAITPEWLENLRTILKPALDEVHERDNAFTYVDGEVLSGFLSGYCPVQGEGFLDGKPWYFRARHDGWSFSVAESTEIDPIDVRWYKAAGWYYEGDYDNASWMAYEDAWDIIKACVEKYFKNEGYTGESSD